MELVGYGLVVAGLLGLLAHEAVALDNGARAAQAAAPLTFLAAWGATAPAVRTYWDTEVE